MIVNKNLSQRDLAGCGTPIKFAFIKEGDMVVDLGSGAGIDVFLRADIVKDTGKVIGLDIPQKGIRITT